MSNAVAGNAAPDLPPPPDLAINTETGEIGTVAELEASAKSPGLERAAVVKPGETVETPAKEPKPAAVVETEKPLAERQAEAAARLRARGAARRTRVAEENQLRGHVQTLEQRLQAEAQTRQAAEQRAAAYESNPLELLKARGQAGKVLTQAAIDENTPEARIARAEARAAQLEQRLETFEQGQARRAREAEATSARDTFVSVATTTTETGDDGKPTDVIAFPHVAAHLKTGRRESILREADALLTIAHARGFRPTYAQVIQHIEDSYVKAATLAGGYAPAEAPTVAEAPKAKPKGANGARALAAKTQERAVAAKRFEDMEARDTSRDGGTDEQLEYIAELARQEARR